MRGNRNTKLVHVEIAAGVSDDHSVDGDGYRVNDHHGDHDGNNDEASSDDSSNSLLLRTSRPAGHAGPSSSSSFDRRHRRRHPNDDESEGSSSARIDSRTWSRGSSSSSRGIAVGRSTHYHGYWLRNNARTLLLSLAVITLWGTTSTRWRRFYMMERDDDNTRSRSQPRQSSSSSSSSTETHSSQVTKVRAKKKGRDPTAPPDLSALIKDFETNIVGNVSWLMDFAIIGHSKCATTTQQTWLRSHPEILMHNREIHSLKNGRPAEMVSLLYALSPIAPTTTGPRPKRGYKAPNDIRSPDVLQSLRTYWPDVKLVIGVRHPVKWFESYYNYNTRQADLGKNGSHHFGPAEVMNVPDHAQFHLHLSQLGKTNVLDPGEQELLGPRVSKQPVRMNNKVFLYEVSQPFDSRENRDAAYRSDLQNFLGLSSPLQPIAVRNRSGDNYHYAIDVCDRRYKYLRHRLVEDGTAAAEWILKYFLPHPDVTVSSPDRFRELLRTWSTDPCAQPK